MAGILDYLPFLGEGPDIPLGPLSNLFPTSTQPPILPRLPNAYRAYNNKYRDPNLQSMLQRLDPSIRNSLLNFDQTRVLRGQNPLSTNQTIGAVQSVANQQKFTESEEQGLFGNAMADLRTLLDIPHVISGLANEVRALPEAPEKFRELLDRSEGIGDVIGGLQEVPGIRDIPGVYTLSNIAGGNAGEIYKHPLFTGLDVLPYAKAPLASTINRAVMWNPETAARVERFRPSVEELATENAARQIAGHAPKPMPTNAQLAFRTNPYVQAVAGTETIQKIGQLVGNEARDVSQLGERWLRTMRAWMDPATKESHPLLHTRDGQILAPLRAWFKEINEYRNTIPTMRRQELTNMLEHRNYDDIIQEAPLTPEEASALAATGKRIGPTQLTDTERGFVHAARAIPEAIANYAIEHNLGLDRVGQDVYPKEVAGKIRTAELNRQTQQNVLGARDRVTAVIPGSLPRDLDIPAFSWEHQSEQASRLIGHAYADAIDLSGFDAAAIRSVLAHPTLDRDAVALAIRDTLANPIERPILSRQEILDKFLPEVQKERRLPGTTYTRIHQYAADGDWAKATALYQRSIHLRGLSANVDDAIILDSMKRYREAGKRLDKLSKTYTDKTLTAANEAEAYVKRVNIPARFTPAIEAAQKAQLAVMFPGDKDSIAKGLYSKVRGLDKDAYDQALHEAIDFIEEARRRGFDPTFVHRVSPGAPVNEIKYPRLSDVAKRMSQEKARTLDPTPYIHDAAIGVSHQLAEVMNQRAVRGFIEQFINAHKIDMQALNAEFIDQAERLHAQNPEIDVRGYMEKLQKRKYVQYDPHDIFPVNQIKLRQSAEFFPDEEIWITRNANETLKRLFRDTQFDRNFAQWDPLMNAFRYSVLAFSIRNQVNNIGGGIILSALENPKILWNSLRRFNTIRHMIKEDELQAIPSMPPSGYATVGPEIKDFEATASLADRVLAAHQYAGGATRRRWLHEFWQSVPGKKDGLFGGIRKAADRMYAFNNYVDEWLRSAGYLTGFDKELNKVFKDQVKKGLMTEEQAVIQAQQAGVALVRKFMPNWDRATPFERNIMRTIFPFYNFSRFLLGYALHYPMDHPFRVAVMAQLVRNEYEGTDWLPERWQSMFFIGHPDEQGNVRAFSPGGINPFTDVANYFSTAGFLGKVNPVISAILESTGTDPSKGSQDLYPDISVNPITGTLQPKNINLASAFIQNLIPQTQVIGALMGRNNDFNNINRTNPEAAAAFMRSGMGLATPWRHINPAQEGFKAELTRQANARTVRNEALRTGDWSRALRFPSLVPFFNNLSQVLASNPQLLEQYRAAGQQGVGDTFLNAMVGAVVPVE